ncbi:dihydroorotate dehydrogenase [miscellaneous Crenarchaeota group-1 archaeon SG8-32-1]|uniref:Dihydroorotate dehydrogenase n=1 Tax=miscellaneous Crenarchaeota group-1 archaeon SG8-32-1 TaxID=1685124 RepID=A0A0M0BNG3_9ARCH|nr:MAG: dihydroorotate dehydrogenase [miscellaneous Crenarchaeota group-1 archaeon SG8-32-1]
MKSKIATQIVGLELANPTILAAGILGYTGLSMKRVIEAGAGAVVTKSMGLEPRTGYQNPTVVQTDCGLLNAMGLPNPGINHFKEEMVELKKLKVPTIFSIYGFSAEEFAKVAVAAVEMGADALELNVSCPHVKKAGAQIGSDPKLLTGIIKKVKNKVKKPIIVKLTPNVTDITEIAKATEKAGADAITAINTVKGMAIDHETGKPILANKLGGLSGPAIKPIAIRCVYDVFSSVNIPVIGCGGITCWQDAIEFIQAGASAIQIGTAVAFKGLNVFSSVANGIETYIKTKHFKNIKDFVGLAHNI